MKKSKLLILFPIMGLFLSGCTFQEGLQSTKSWINSHIYQPLKSFFSSSSTPSEEGKKDEEKKEEEKKEDEKAGKVISFESFVKSYTDAGFTGVEIPDYNCADASATMSAIEGYDGYYLIKPSTTDEMKAFVNSFSSSWDKETDSYGDYYLYLGSDLEPGESCPFIYVADYTAESLAGIVLCFSVYEEPEVTASFPLEEVNAYLTTNSGYYGFTFSQDEADAISALSTSFSFQSGTDSYGYPIAQVTIAGDVADALLAIIDSTVTGAGFSWDSEEGYYINSSYCMIYAEAEEGTTYFVLN